MIVCILRRSQYFHHSLNRSVKNFNQFQQCSLWSQWLLFSWEIFENWELFYRLLSVVCVIIRHISDDGLFLLVRLETSSMDYAWNRRRRRRLDSYKFIDNENKFWLFPVSKTFPSHSSTTHNLFTGIFKVQSIWNLFPNKINQCSG